MFKTFVNAWKIPELRKKILFTAFILLIFRIGAAIPVPFINVGAEGIFSGSQMQGTYDIRNVYHTLHQQLHHHAAAYGCDPRS